MTIETWQAIAAIFGLLFVMTYGQARYWKAVATTLRAEHEDGGWINEAKFWRYCFDKDASEWLEEHS